MKKIIDGKRYNTETAIEIADWTNEHYPHDFQYCSETLYKTPKGAYFLHGTGGGLSKYAESCGQNSWTGGSDIILLTVDEAKCWLEQTDNVDALESEFPGDVVDA